MKFKIYYLYLILGFILLQFQYGFAQPSFVIQIFTGGSVILSTYVGGDEFNQSSIDYSIWRDSYPWGRSLDHEICWQSPGLNSAIVNGKLKITTTLDPGYRLRECGGNMNPTYNCGEGPNYRFYEYTSGMLFSKQKFDYGLYFINCKLPLGKGVWPAFWIYSGNPNYEIDVFEYKGETPNKIHWAVHCPACTTCTTCPSPGSWVTANGSFANSFNTMFSDWQNNYVVWGLNAAEYAGYSAQINVPGNVIVGSGVSWPGGPFPPGPDATTPTSTEMDIEYIRMYKRIDCDVDNIQCNYDQSSIYTPSVFTGRNVTFGGSTCSSNLANDQFLTLVGSESVMLSEGFDAQLGSTLSATVVDCGPFAVPPTMDLVMDNGELAITTEESRFATNNSVDSSLIQQGNVNSKGIENNETAFFLGIYPNPTGGILKLEFTGPQVDELFVEILDIQNSVVFSQHLKGEFTLDLSHLGKGTYSLFCKIGNETIYKRIIVI